MGMQVQMDDITIVNESEAGCDLLHDVPNSATVGKGGCIVEEGFTRGFPRKGLSHCHAVNPGFQVHIVQFCVDIRGPVWKHAVTEVSDDIPIPSFVVDTLH